MISRRQWNLRPAPMQVVFVMLAVIALTILTDRWNYRSGWNALWMSGLPIAIAVTTNKDAGSRALMGLALVILSPLAMIVTAAVLGLGA